MASNIEYLNGVRNLASEIYQDRIPVATKENLAEVTQAIPKQQKWVYRSIN